MRQRKRVTEFHPLEILRLSLPAAILFSLLATISLQGLLPWQNPAIVLAGGNNSAILLTLAVFVPGVLVRSSQAYLYCIARPWCGRWFAALGFANLLAALLCAGALCICGIWFLDRALQAVLQWFSRL